MGARASVRSLTERHVQAIWYDGVLRPKHLVTRSGLDVAVIHPGDWNLEAGPDFRGAVLELGTERRRVTGDVEVHLCPSDWDFHGHGADPRYRNVVAHVTWGCGPEPRDLPPGAESIWLGRFAAADPSFAPEQIDLEAYPYARLPGGERPCARRLGGDSEAAARLLSAAGRHRLAMKARRLTGRLCAAAGQRKQVFYEEVMGALGYRQNTRQFRHVAERVPIDAWPDDLESARMAVLTAGQFEDWDRTAQRPRNAPERRLAAAADLFVSTSALRLADADAFSRTACKTIVDVLCGDGLLGRGRAAAILANVVVPFAIAEERVSSVPDWLPPEDVSSPVRLTAYRLFGRDHNPSAYYATNGLHIQGLLQIHRDYCLQHHPACSNCALGMVDC